MVRLKTVEIHNRIQRAVRKRPMTTYQLSTETNIRFDTIKKHLNYLEGLYVIEEREVKNYATGEISLLWYPLSKSERKKKTKKEGVICDSCRKIIKEQLRILKWKKPELGTEERKYAIMVLEKLLSEGANWVQEILPS